MALASDELASFEFTEEQQQAYRDAVKAAHAKAVDDAVNAVGATVGKMIEAVMLETVHILNGGDQGIKLTTAIIIFKAAMDVVTDLAKQGPGGS